MQHIRFILNYNVIKFLLARVTRALTHAARGARLQSSPNQVLTHAARAAAEQLNKPAPLVAARGARKGLWLEQAANQLKVPFQVPLVAVKQLRCLVFRHLWHAAAKQLRYLFRSGTSGGYYARRALVRVIAFDK